MKVLQHLDRKEEFMNRLIEIGTIFFITLALTGSAFSSEAPEKVNAQSEQLKSDFPSQSLYKIVWCDKDIKCGNKIPKHSKIAFIKNTEGDKWILWKEFDVNDHDKKGKLTEICEGSFNRDNKFTCPACGREDGLSITEVTPSPEDCDFKYCLHFNYTGPSCPEPGDGKGGHN